MNSCQGFKKIVTKKDGEILLTDSYTKVSSFNSSKSCNIRIFRSEKIEVDGDLKLLKAMARTTFLCKKYIGLI